MQIEEVVDRICEEEESEREKKQLLQYGIALGTSLFLGVSLGATTVNALVDLDSSVGIDGRMANISSHLLWRPCGDIDEHT